jgi:hypothetical protein
MSEAETLTPQEYGRIGARRRWGPPRRINIGDLSAPQRTLILALVDAARSNEKAAADVQRPTAAQENDGGSRRLPTAG